MHHILGVIPGEDYVLQLFFEENEAWLFDLKPYLRGSLFLPLQDVELFKKVEVSERPRGLIWPNGADLCADMLYMNSRPYEADKTRKPSRLIHSEASVHHEEKRLTADYTDDADVETTGP